MSEDRDEPESVEPSEAFDASNPAQVRERRRSARVLASQRKEFFGRLLADPTSRRFCWEILSDLKVFEQRFVEPTTPAHAEAAWFMFGQREAGLKIFRLLLAEQPQLAAMMIAEIDA